MDKKSKILHNSWRKWARTPPTRAKNSKNTKLNGSGGLVALTGTNSPSDQWSRLEPPIGTNGGSFALVGGSNRDKKPLGPHAARLAVGPGTKALFGPGSKGSRDKWPGPMAYSVVVKLQFSHVFDSNSTRTIDVVVQARSYGTFGCAKIWVLNKA